MDISSWNLLTQNCSFKKRYLKSARFRNDHKTEFLDYNRKILMIMPEEFKIFLSKFTGNQKKSGYLLSLFKSLQDVIHNEEDSANENELFPIITKEIEIYKSLSRDLTPLLRDKRSLKVIGYGEITSSVTLSGGKHLTDDSDVFYSDLVCKSLPAFPDEESVGKYKNAFDRYILELTNLGISMPPQKIVTLGRDAEGIRVYVVQGKLPSHLVGNTLIRRMEIPEALEFFEKILLEMKKVFRVNLKDTDFKIALDGQISNWVYHKDGEIQYIDTSTPLFRINGQEQLDPELFLKNTPWFLRGIIRMFFLQDVLDRYYDFRSVIVDLIANLYKEKRPDLILPFIDRTNQMLSKELADFSMEEFTEKEIRKYYKEDAFIWKFFQTARKVDKFITEKILRKKYKFRLPEKIER